MQFEEITEEEEKSLKFDTAVRSGGGSNPYGPLIEAVKTGKKIKVMLREGQAMKNLKWALSGAAKRASIKLNVKVLADKSGVVVSVVPALPAPAVPSPPAPVEETKKK